MLHTASIELDLVGEQDMYPEEKLKAINNKRQGHRIKFKVVKGQVRIHDASVQKLMFKVLGFSDEEANE